MQQQIISPADAIRMEATGLVPDHMMDSALPAILKAEIDSQIATAKAFPRSIHKAIENICTLATLDEETAAECLYALVRKKKQRGRNGPTDDTENKPIEGPSIRLAEIAAQCWGNNRIKARVITVNKKDGWVEALGVFHDLETNMASEATIRRNILTSGGHVFSNDMITVTGNAAAAIAKRNAILAGIPRGVTRQAYYAARAIVAGTTATLSENREKAIKAFASFGVTPDQIFEALGIEGEGDIKLDHIATLRGMFMSIKNGEATVEEMFAKEKPADSDPNYNPLVKGTTGANDQRTTGGANEVADESQQGQTHQADASETENRSGADQQNGQAGEKPATDSGQGTSGATQSRDQASASPAPADAGTSQSDNGSSQPDLLSGTVPPAGSKAQPSESQPSAEGADKDSRGGTTGSAPDLSSYHKTLATIENGGPPKLGRMSDSWINKNGKFTGGQEKKRAEVYAVHVERLTGAIDMAACNKRVEGIIAK
ncbi:hypothetical protein [Bradyrhizobium sp. Ai1a-2]|uniref:hypothetical protein n=1 Tax=Bradyrhizobium sp. Ai1a-2 TaxID=196490 RepID=UPI000427E6D7|nr:hypothetical protein [Bradyrhizobium sp. Ai1a-2]